MSGKIRAEKLLKFLRKIMTRKQNDKKTFYKTSRNFHHEKSKNYPLRFI
ncbi:hypothetical protein IFVP18_C150346 [Vibrio parahaemolyticus]